MILAAAAVLCATTGCIPGRSRASDHTRAPWLQYGAPEDAGYSQAGLEAARQLADSVQSGAVMAIHRGHVLVAWGDIARKFRAHSVRKSLVSALYGSAVLEGLIDLDWTLSDIGIDDATALTERERSARARDLIASRSGVYLPSAYAASSQLAELPERGSRGPDSQWAYNNWDFNVAGVIFERTTGEDLYAAFEDRIARPIGMEDFLPEDGFRVYEPSRSLHPAHTFRMSTRDLARFGQLYLQRGEWGGRSVVPAEWVRESTRPHSDFGGGRGYGYMWWTYAAGSLGDDNPNIGRHDLYLARGTGGQTVFVIPDAELVVVHRGDTDNGREVPGPAIWTIVERLLAARVGDAVPAPRLVPLEPTPLESQAPPPPPLRFVDLDPRTVARYLGEYEIAPGTNIRVSLFEGRLFGFVPGEGDAELFALSRTEFTVEVIDGVRVVFEEDEAGDVTHLVLTMGDQVVRAHRLQ